VTGNGFYFIRGEKRRGLKKSRGWKGKKVLITRWELPILIDVGSRDVGKQVGNPGKKRNVEGIVHNPDEMRQPKGVRRTRGELGLNAALPTNGRYIHSLPRDRMLK